MLFIKEGSQKVANGIATSECLLFDEKGLFSKEDRELAIVVQLATFVQLATRITVQLVTPTISATCKS